ncbi:MAG: hypothetical protein AB1938_03210 [Myxococcota bacterium]
MGSLWVAAFRGRWGLVLEGGLESARVESLAPGRVWAAMQWLSLGPSVVFRPWAHWRIDVTLAVRGTRLEAGAEGYPSNDRTVLFAFGGVASGGVSRQLVGPLWAQLRAFVSVRTPAEALTVANAGTVSLGPWEAGGLVGLSVDWEFPQ